jgi:hypothetical protein
MNYVVIYFTIIFKVFGFKETLKDHLAEAALISLVYFFMAILTLVLWNKYKEIEDRKEMAILKEFNQVYFQKDKLQEIQDMLKSLDQGIILQKEQTSIFENSEFRNFNENVKSCLSASEKDTDLMNVKFLKICDKLNSSKKISSLKNLSEQGKGEQEKVYSIQNLIDDKKLQSSVFRTNLKKDE